MSRKKGPLHSGIYFSGYPADTPHIVRKQTVIDFAVLSPEWGALKRRDEVDEVMTVFFMYTKCRMGALPEQGKRPFPPGTAAAAPVSFFS